MEQGNVRDPRRSLRTPPPHCELATPPATPKKTTTTPDSPMPKSPRSPRKSTSIIQSFELRKKEYLWHLEQWASVPDPSTHFQGTLRILHPEKQADNLELGKSVNCVLTDGAWTDARRHVTVRLFPPRPSTSNEESTRNYQLMIRSGSGWATAREVLEKAHFANRRIKQGQEFRSHHYADRNAALTLQSARLGPKPTEKDAIIVGPRFHDFLRLPIELQLHILSFAVNKTKLLLPSKDRRGGKAGFYSYVGTGHPVKEPSPTTLTNVFLISKALNDQLIPYFYRTTSFWLKTQGLTNFLWLAGSENRKHNIKKMTLSFGNFALLHCIRWFAPDEIFTLFDPKLTPYNEDSGCGTQYYWRCVVRDLVAELQLKELTIDVEKVPREDVAFVVRCLRHCFGDIEGMRFIGKGGEAAGASVKTILSQPLSWSRLCRDAFVRHRNDPYHGHMFEPEVKKMKVEDLDAKMAEEKEWFEQIDTAVDAYYRWSC